MKTVTIPAALLKQVITSSRVSCQDDVDLIRKLEELIKPYGKAIAEKREQLVTSGWSDFVKYGIKSEAYEQPFQNGLIDRKGYYKALLQSQGKLDTLYRVYNKDVVFFTMDSGYGDIHHNDGSIASTYLTGFTREFTEVAGITLSITLSEIKNIDNELVMEGKRVISSTQELAEYLVDNDIQPTVMDYKTSAKHPKVTEASDKPIDWDELREMFSGMHHIVLKGCKAPKHNEEQYPKADPRYQAGIMPIINDFFSEKPTPFKGFVPGVDPLVSLKEFMDVNIKARSKAKKEMFEAKQEHALGVLIPTALKEILTELSQSRLASEKIGEDLFDIYVKAMLSDFSEQVVANAQDTVKKHHPFFSHFVTVVK